MLSSATTGGLVDNGSLGLVKDTREARFEAGLGEVQFADVAAQIDPTSVHLRSLTDPTGLRIVEQLIPAR